MIEGVGRYVGGKMLTAILAVASVLVIVWYWRLPEDARAALWTTVRGALIWAGFVAVLPWALFFVPTLVVRAENNWVSAAALLGYLLADIGFALYLTGGETGSRWQTGAMLVGFALAGIYNFVVCDFLADRSEESV